MRLRHIFGVLIVLAIALAGAFAYHAWEPAIAAVDPPARERFADADIRRGADLAALGNCAECHSVSGRPALAGGRPLATPFGTIFSTNITPDPATGIGRWSEAAFARAMRRGVDREGRHLYPAFPYDHFTRLADDDVRALYAYAMTRPAVAARTPANDLVFPLNFRPVVAGWKLLFFTEGRHRDDPAQSAEWNRGAYLAEGIAHCGGCHTPRNAFGAEKASAHFAGGEAEGWHAYAIDRTSPAPVPWDATALQFYLRHGWHPQHGVSRGPMAPVTANLASVPEADVRAIATYVAARIGPPDAAKVRRGEEMVARARDEAAGRTMTTAGGSRGAALYAAACASCHDGARPLPRGGLNLHLSTAVNADDPVNIVHVVRQGLPAAEGERSSIMPGYFGILSNAQLVDLLAYMREAFAGKPPWDDLARRVAVPLVPSYPIVARDPLGDATAAAVPEIR